SDTRRGLTTARDGSGAPRPVLPVRARRRTSATTSDGGRLFRGAAELPAYGWRKLLRQCDHGTGLRRNQQPCGACQLEPRLAPDPQRRAVRMLTRPDERGRGPGEPLPSADGLGTDWRGGALA